MEKKDQLNPFGLSAPVGPHGKNDRLDVAKVESLMGASDEFDVARTDGPTGYYGERLKQSVQSYQKKNGLKVDGVLKPDGETLRKISDRSSDEAAEYWIPMLEADAENVRFQNHDSFISRAIKWLDRFTEEQSWREPRPKMPPFPPELMPTGGTANRQRG